MENNIKNEYLAEEKNENQYKMNCGIPPQFRLIPEIKIANLSANRKAFAVKAKFRWGVGTKIRFYFMNELSKSPDAKKVVREAFREWEDIGISISFTEVISIDKSDIRIEFAEDGINWSLIGNDALNHKGEATMHFGESLYNDYDGRQVAMHEVGHTLSLQHEHQSPNFPLTWDEQKLIEYYTNEYGWDYEMIQHNVLIKLQQGTVTATDWDSKSIMEYPFPPGVIQNDPYNLEGIKKNYFLSSVDREFILQIYPSISLSSQKNILHRTLVLNLKSGQGETFYYTPPSRGMYKIQVTGDFDAYLIVFDPNGIRMAEDDDTNYISSSHQANVVVPLQDLTKYSIFVRLYGTDDKNPTAVLVAKNCN